LADHTGYGTITKNSQVTLGDRVAPDKAGYPTPAFGPLTMWVPVGVKMRKKGFIVNNMTRQYWAWQWIRRNEDYRRDFRKFGSSHRVPQEVWHKWNMHKLIDPSDPDPGRDYLISPPYRVIAQSPNTFERPYSFIAPGTKYKGKRGHTWKTPEGYWAVLPIYETAKSWKIEDRMKEFQEFYEKYPEEDALSNRDKDLGIRKLTRKNFPRAISVVVRFPHHDLPFHKTDLINEVTQLFRDELEEFLKARKAIFKPKTALRPRHDLFFDYMRVYDRKKKNPNMSWSDIAKEIFPDKIEKHVSPHRKIVREIVSSSTKDVVRKYWKQADRLINREGWKYLF
jgi:Proteobacterial transcriptional regulator-like domain